MLLYPKNIEDKLNFEIIRNKTAEFCMSDKARQKVYASKFSNNFEKILLRLRQTSEMKDIVLFEEKFPMGFFPNSDEHFAQKQRQGSYFKPNELMELKASILSMQSLIQFFNNPKNKEFPNLKKLLPDNQFASIIISIIDGVLDKHGNIKNNASKELKTIRHELDAKKISISRKLNQIITQAKSDGTLKSDAQAVIREGKLLIPVSVSDKRRIKGIIYDISASGQTAYIEPYEISELNNKVRELEMAENREVINILTNITQELQPYFYNLRQTYNFLAEIDFIRAKAKLAITLNASIPILHEKPDTEFLNAAHPLLLLAYKNQNKTVVRSDIKLDYQNRMMIISGPNAGGKSICLKTMGILQYMLQCGFLIPVKETSETGIYKNIFLDIGDQQSVENDLSTYSSHLLNMNTFVNNATENSLVLIDEMGSGTEPHLGAVIAEAVLEALNENKVKAIVTTHYTNLKTFAEETKGVFNSAMLFDKKRLQPLYKLEPFTPGSSFAFEIAKKTGFSKKILQSAESKLDRQHLDFETILQKNIEEKRKLRRLKRKIQTEEREIAELKEKYQKATDFILSEKKTILANTKKEADKILQSTNKRIENTISQIRKAQADKKITKELRLELDEYKNKFREKISEKEEKLEKHITKKRKQKLNNEHIASPLQVGDFVKIEGQNQTANIIKLNGKQATISLGNMSMTVKTSQLRKVANKPAKTPNRKVKIISDTDASENMIFGIDIRGKRVADAIFIVQKYIDKALITRSKHLKILHGTGNGVLRHAVREYLASHELVKSFKDEHPEAGGHGITLAELNF